MTFQEEILLGIPDELPQVKAYDPDINHAPKRKDILSPQEKVLALKNAVEIMTHYKRFPETEDGFGQWCAKADEIYEKIGKIK